MPLQVIPQPARVNVRHLRRIVCCALLSLLVACDDTNQPAPVAVEQNPRDIFDDPGGANWLSYGRTYDENRFSPLGQINESTVSDLGLAWSLPLPGTGSLVSTPLAVDGVLYFSTEYSRVFAVEAKSGKVLWKFDPKVTDVGGRHLRALANNKGIAYWEGRIYVGTVDGRLIAIDAASGNELWSVQTRDSDIPRNIGGAPRVFGGKVIIGHGGADFYAIRGYVTAYDAVSGELAWRFHTVPGNPADGFENEAMEMAASTWTGRWWEHGGGGTVWNGMTYDPEFNRIYIGTGNGSPWNRRIRSPGGGDNLFLCSIVALDADTGEYVWHYQTNPGETWDYNSVMDIVLSDAKIDGEEIPVIYHAPKNGFFYVIDRRDGRLVSAEKFVRVNWAEKIDIETGRPVETPQARYPDGPVEIMPSSSGGHNWQPMSYNPETGLVYFPAMEKSKVYSDQRVDLDNWQRVPYAINPGIGGTDMKPTIESEGFLLAWDPLQQQEAWRVAMPTTNNGGTLTTAGNLVVHGNGGGDLVVYAADTGEELWSRDVGWGISAAPITYLVDGEQYISIGVGWGAMAGRAGHDNTMPARWQYGKGTSTMLTFKLGANEPLPTIGQAGVDAPWDDPDIVINQSLIGRGGKLYAQFCSYCHGRELGSGGGAPDLKISRAGAYLESLRPILLEGALEPGGMPSFDEFTEEDVSAIHAYIRYVVRNAIPGEVSEAGMAN